MATRIWAFAIVILTLFPSAILSQCNPGLHAGIRATFVPSREGLTQEPYVMVLLVLLNDSDKPIDVQAASWKIVINGTELKDSGFIFGNGPMPVDGYTSLKPGDNYELGKGLPISKYFIDPGDYTISWKAEGFQSSTITVTVPPSGNSSRKPTSNPLQHH